jgi:hypothetical protein
VTAAEWHWVPSDLVSKVKMVLSWLQVRSPSSAAQRRSAVLGAKYVDDAHIDLALHH